MFWSLNDKQNDIWIFPVGQRVKQLSKKEFVLDSKLKHSHLMILMILYYYCILQVIPYINAYVTQFRKSA